MSFTPGPWTVEQDYNDVSHQYESFVLGSKGDVVAECDDGANARLIAAAPELLAALEWIALDSRVQYEGGCGDIARTAIAKATGTEVPT